LYFCFIRCRFEVWKKKTNLIVFSSMVFFLFLLLSVLFLIFCHLFFNFLLRLFYCLSLFCFMFKYIYVICFHFVSTFKCLNLFSNCQSVFSVFIFFLVFSLLKIYICSVFIFFVTTLFHFIYLSCPIHIQKNTPER